MIDGLQSLLRFPRHSLLRTTLFGLSFTFAISATLSAEEPNRIFMPSWPALSPDATTIVFEWRDDLWAVPFEGGRAERITAHPARDSHPQFSSDGQTIYFSSSRSGSLQLYSMAREGGPATQHSHHSSGGVLEGLSPDGRTAILRGERDEPGFRPTRLIEIDLQGPSPERFLFNQTASSSAWLPNAQQILFCRGGEQFYRKGYRGSRASSIWSYSTQSKTFSALVKEDTEARSPMPWPDSQGFYYLSERSGCFNIWSRTLTGDQDEQLTHFEDDGVMLPALSRDGSALVFRRGFHLWTFHPGSEEPPQQLELWHTEDLADHTTEVLEIDGTVDADFSPSGLEIVFKAKGELWTMDTVLREPNRITRTAGEEDDPVFSPDGQFIYYQYDDGLEANIWRLARRDSTDYWWRAQSFESEQITFGPDPKSRFSLSPDGQRSAWISGSGDLTVANADGSNPRVLFQCWDPPTFSWSPDGSWIAFSAQDRNFNRDIYVIPSDGTLEPFNISRHPDFEGSPRWSPDGRKIAFIGRRLNNEMGLFYVDLRLEEAFRSSRAKRELEAEAAMRDDPFYQQEETTEVAAPSTHDLPDLTQPGEPITPSSNLTSPLRIDFEGLSDRVIRLSTRGIEPERVLWSHDSKHLIFQSKNHSNDRLYRIEARPGAKMKEHDHHRGLPIRDSEDGLYWIVDRTPSILKAGKLIEYPISARMVRDRTAHQRLCFLLIWRTLRDRFYDSTMNGHDWNEVREKYEQAAADAPVSRIFERVVAQMLGELNASHMNFRATPWPEPWENEGAEFQTTRHTGIKFARHGSGEPMTVAAVIADSPASTCEPAIEVGDTILKINGRQVDSDTPIHSFMNGRMDRRISLQLRDSQGHQQNYEIDPISYEKATLLAEAEVITKNRKLVDELSNGQLGYVHIARMLWDQFEQFERQIYDAGHGKSGLIIDIRDNGGGFITDHLLTVLCQPQHALTIPRNGRPGYPQGRRVYASWHKPLVVICNENSYSNAEIFAHAIQTLKRGKVIGVPTAGGVISADQDHVLDAGVMRIPFRGWFLPESGEDMEMNGAVPDILVEADPNDLLAGKDKQLETAIEVLLQDVANEVRKPFSPRYRNRPADDDSHAASPSIR
ncbi:MAG: S41 family peptidase [Verrucomicrobiales bacterium]